MPDAERRTLLEQLVTTLAQMHNHGIWQSDLHLDNFMLCDGLLYVIDGATIESDSANKPLSVRKSLQNLAVLFAQFYPLYDPLLDQAFGEYKHERGWSEMPSWTEQEKLFLSARKKRLSRYQKKLLRATSAHACIQERGFFALCQRSLFGDELDACLHNLDSLIEDSEKLKLGNSATVVRGALAGIDCVVKRYNIKGVWHGLKRQWTHSRALNSWQAAHMLQMVGLSTPQPIAVVQKYRGPLRAESYFIAEAVPSGFQSLQQKIDEGLTRAEGEALLEPVFVSLERAQLSHGDFKASNLFVQGDKVMIIDLDAVSHHDSLSQARKYINKDRLRFARNWSEPS